MERMFEMEKEVAEKKIRDKRLRRNNSQGDSELTSIGSIKIPTKDDGTQSKNLPSWRKLSNRLLKKKPWSKNDEELMMQHIREMRVRLAKYSRTAPWKKVLMGSINKIKMKDEEIKPSEDSFRKLREMAYADYAKWVSTLPTLNKCVDKQYLNECLKKMTQDEILAIKTDISNKVIEEYRINQSKNENRRFNYFAKKVEEIKKKRPKTANTKSL